MCCRIKIFGVCKVRNGEGAPCFMGLVVLMFWILGIVCIGLGVCILASFGFGIMTQESALQIAVPLMLGFGLIFFISGFITCCWACSDDNCCLRFMVGIAVAFLLVIMITAAVKTLGDKSEISDAFDDAVRPMYQKYDGDASLSEDVDTFQIKFHCCGYTGLDDFENGTWGVKHGNELPQSCCQSLYESCMVNVTNSYWDQTCRDVVDRDFIGQLKYIGAGAICVILFMVICSCIACCCTGGHINV